jgi:CPA2 family monovalent cation:H+ antiporter-2
MEQVPFLRDLVVVYSFSAAVVYLFHKLNQSAIVGFLVAGILVGPYGLSLVGGTESVHVLAEIGVMLLLFSLGLEFSLEKLLQMRHVVLGTGSAQIITTILLVLAVTVYLDISPPMGVFLGFLIALSSTAIVVKVLMERREIDSIHGRVALGLLIFQDLCVVPMIVIIPLLAGQETHWLAVGQALLTAFLIIAAVVIVARYVFPLVLHQIVGTRSKELFVITAILMFLGTAWITSEAGFSLALGAFLAGLILSGSEYSHQVFADIRPLRDSLNSLFFISMGMLVDPAFVWSHLGTVLAVLGSVVIGKALIVAGAVLVTGLPLQVAILNGLGLAQIGEFSFVLLEEGAGVALVPPDWYQIILSVAVVTMILTPSFFSLSRLLVSVPIVGKWAVLTSRARTIRELDAAKEELKDHVILCGFGASGRNIARALKANNIAYVVLELNAQTVRGERRNGEPIYFGDCTDSKILEHAGILQARVIVFAISDPFSTRRVVRVTRDLNRDIVILIRTRYISEFDELYKLGATEVVPEEFEASIELLTRILRIFHLPRQLVALEVKSIREGRYGLFRKSKATVPRLRLSKDLDVYTEAVAVKKESAVCNKAIAESGLRRKSGALILGIVRDGQTINNPSASETILPGDLLILSGSKDQLDRAMQLLFYGTLRSEQG